MAFIEARVSEYEEIAGLDQGDEVIAKAEIEKKFNVLAFPNTFLHELISSPKVHITQGYTETGVRLRAQTQDGVTTYTVSYKQKVSEDGVIRNEPETHISKERFAQYWKRVGNRIVRKDRVFVPDGFGNTIHVDIYQGELAGLVVAEVEFPTEEKARSYKVPSKMLDRTGKNVVDVTGWAEYSNKNLAYRVSQGKNTRRLYNAS